MKLAKEYFGLQIKFCKKYSEISGRDFLNILPLYSDFLNRLWIGKKKEDVSLDLQNYFPNKNWKRFLKSFSMKKPVLSCYDYYLNELSHRRKKGKERTSFFRYEIKKEGKVLRIHTNAYFLDDKTGFSPLIKEEYFF